MYKQEEPEVDIEQILDRIRSFFKQFRMGGGLFPILTLVLAVFVVFWLVTGIYTVQPGEKAAVRFFGEYSRSSTGTFVGGSDPGLHWYWPSPIGTLSKVQVDEVRRLELGVRNGSSIPEEAFMITGDDNIVDVQMLVQYDVNDIELFLFHVIDPTGRTIKDAAETALRQVVGSRAIDDVLTTEKEAVQADTRMLLQTLLDRYGAGIRIREVKLLNVDPPPEVRDAFDDVVRAREDKERIRNLAEAYEEDILPRARGDAARFIQEAEGFRAERVNRATGESQKFLNILEEYEKSKQVTRRRLYLETLEVVLSDITKIVGDPKTIILSAPQAEKNRLVVPIPQVE